MWFSPFNPDLRRRLHAPFFLGEPAQKPLYFPYLKRQTCHVAVMIAL